MSAMESDLARQLEEQALRLIWSGTEWLDVKALAVTFGHPPKLLLIWEAELKLFSLQRDGSRMYPAYCFGDDGTPLPVIAEVQGVLNKRSPHGLAAWFESTSSFLGGARPRELVGTKPNLVLAAARYHLEQELYAG